jgi:SOS-response transcriptional repressor LexA
MKSGEHEGVDSETAASACVHPATQITRGGPIYPEVAGHPGVTRWAVYQHVRLQVKGDSRVGRQISHGDDVLVRAQPWAEHEVVGVVVIDAVVTVKTIPRQRTGPWPKPENQEQGYPLIHLQPQQRI